MKNQDFNRNFNTDINANSFETNSSQKNKISSNLLKAVKFKRAAQSQASQPTEEVVDDEIPASSRTSQNHIRQLSYVRVLGLALVLTYHFWPNFMPGGFFGVDVFFVFSGYLITALALQEVRKHGHFDAKHFTQRRFFRIFPTVAFAMLVILPFTLAAPETIKYQLRQQVFAGLSFITNFYEISTGTSYANNFAPHIWIHLWSLALEVQFYVLWGLIIWLIAKVVRNKAGKMTVLVTLASLFLILFSGLSMFLSSFTKTSLSTLYYSVFTHIFPFFFGSFLATLAGIHASKLIYQQAAKYSKQQVIRNAVISALVLIILAFIFNFNWKATYLIGFLLVSLSAMSFIFWLRLLHTKTDKAEPRVIIFFANISYGIYIFHWPFLTIFRAEKFSNLTAVLLTLILSIALSALMFYGIDPVLQGRRTFRIPAVKWGTVAATVLLVIVAIPALAGTTEQTSLERSLWEAKNAQASSTLSFAQNYLKSGVTAKMTGIIIGDSVTVQESQNIAKKYPNLLIDAESSRRIDTGLQPEIDKYLPYLDKNATLIIALGINSVYPDQDKASLQKVVSSYYKTRKIILVTPGNADEADQTPESKQVVAFERQLAQKYKNVSLDDWEASLNGHYDWVSPDGIHPSGYPAGMNAWMNNLEQAIQASGAKI